MSGACPYQATNHSGRNLDNYCYYGRDGEVEEFGTNRYTTTFGLSTAEQESIARNINSAMRESLDPHNNQALSLHTDGMNDVKNPILTGEYDVSCDDTDGLIGSNRVVTETYTVDYEARVDCESSNPIAVIKTMLKFREEPGSDPNCLQAQATRTVDMDTSTTGTSGIIRGAVEKSIGLKTELTDQLDALPPRETIYSQEDHCRFPVNQTFTPAPSPFPSSTPSYTPLPSSTPSSTPSYTPLPSSTPSSTPSFTPLPSSTPSSTPSFTPLPSSTPSSTPSFTPAPAPGDFFEEHRTMIIIIAAIVFVALVILGVFLYRRWNEGQVYTGRGPSVPRENPDTPPSSRRNSSSTSTTPPNPSATLPPPSRAPSPTQKTPLLTPTPQPPLSINSGGNLFDGMEGEFFDVDFEDVIDLQKKDN